MRLSSRRLLAIDRWFYPLNLLLRGRSFSPARKTQTGRVVIIKLMGLGSIIRLLSVCKERDVDLSRVVLITFASNQEACQLLGMDHCIFIRTQNIFLFFGDCLKTVFAMNRMRPDWIIDFERCSNAVSVFRQSLALVGNSSTLAFDDLQPVQTARHTVLNINQYSFHEMLLKGIHNLPFAKQSLVKDALPARDSNIVVVNINCSDYLLARRYPRQLFREVIEELGRAKDVTFYLTGVSSEHEYVEELTAEITRSGIKAHNVAGAWSLTQVQQALMTTSLFISGDSGPVHLAIHLGVPTVAIWGPTRPQHFGYGDNDVLVNVSQDIPCAPCFMHPRSMPAHSCKGQISCLRDLSPHQIVRAAEMLLDRSRQNLLTPAASW